MNLNNWVAKITPEKTFIILAFVFGLSLVFLTPPFQVADEPNHFYRSYELSEFKLVAQKINNTSGDFIPKTITVMVADLIGDIPFHKDQKFSLSKLKKYRNQKIDFKDRQFVDFRNTALYSPIVYLPQVAGMWTAKIANLSPLMMIYPGRLFNLFVFIALAYFAIKLTPFCKWGFTLLSLMPMTLYQAASLSADSVCFGLSFLFIAYILRCAFSEEKKLSNRQILKIALLSILLGLCKSAYFFLPFLFLLIPIEKIGSKMKYISSFSLISLLTALGSITWGFFVKSVYVPIFSYVNPNEQILQILLHPQNFVFAFCKSLGHIGILHSFVGNLGWLDNSLPLAFIVLFLGVVLLSAIFENSKNLSPSLNQKIILLSVIALSLVLINLLIYLSYNLVGALTIEGIQGRYFIPLAPMFLILFINKRTIKLKGTSKNTKKPNVLQIVKRVNPPRPLRERVGVRGLQRVEKCVFRGALNIFLACFLFATQIITLISVIKRYYL